MQRANLSLATFVTPPDCGITPSNGSVQIVVSGSTGSPTYSWSPGGATTSTLGNIAPGNYTVLCFRIRFQVVLKRM